MARKSTPVTPVPTTREAFEALAVKLGDDMRQLETAAANTASQIAAAKLALKKATGDLSKRIDAQFAALVGYATANREQLLPSNRKSVSIAAGVVGFRLGNPSVVYTADEAEVIEAIEAAGLVQFLREKTEIDKQALLADRETAETIAGIAIRQTENFFFQALDLTDELTKTLTVVPAATSEAA